MHETTKEIVGLGVAAYLLGSIPFGLVVARVFGSRDVRKEGSGNIGATNVARVAGPLPGLLTLALDAGKGMLAVWLAARWSGQGALAMTVAGVMALVGHCFPVWLGFRGGKGVATALGVFGVLAPLALLAAAIVFGVIFGLWRYVSLASVSAAAAMPLLVYLLWAPGHAPPLVVTVGVVFAALLVIVKHKGNLQRLVAGTEPKFGTGSAKDEDG